MKKNINTHLKELPGIASLIRIENGADSSKEARYSLQFSSFCYQMCKTIHTPKWKVLRVKSNVKGKAEKEILLENIQKLSEDIMPKIKDFHSNPAKALDNFNGDAVDFLYHYYISERISNLNLFCSLLSNIDYFEKETMFTLLDENILSILCLGRLLPNSFSRQYWIRYALEQLIDRPNSATDFWDFNSPKRNDNAMEIIPGPTGFYFFKWIRQYEKFIKFMISFVIPVYEWCFVDMLLRAIESAYPDESHATHLLRAMESLAEYMRKNYFSILQPIYFESSSKPSKKRELQMSMLDIISKQKDGFKYLDFPEEMIHQVMEEFFSPLNEQTILFTDEPSDSDKDTKNNVNSFDSTNAPKECWEHQDNKEPQRFYDSFDVELNLTPINSAFFTSVSKRKKKTPADINSNLIKRMYIEIVRRNYLE